MKSKKLKGVLYAFLPIIILFVLYFFIAGPSFSSSVYYLPEKDDGYEITSYDVNAKIDENGRYHIEETIEANFFEPSHGILRWLQRYQTASYINTKGKFVSQNYRVQVSDFKSSQYVDSDVQNDYVVYYLGSSAKYVTGVQTYHLSYVFDISDDRDDSMDMIYFNIIGTGWNTKISNITFSIELPKVVDDNIKFYVGKYGETNGADRVSYSFVDGTKITGSVASLDYGEAVTIFKSVENGYFKYEHSIILDLVMFVAFVIALCLFAVFFVKNRRKSPIVEVVEFAPPEGISPTDAGYLNDLEVTGDDLSALLVYWASKGIVNVIEKEKGKKKQIFIQKIADLPEGSKEHEKILFKDLFKKQEIIDVEDISSNLSLETGYKCVKSVENDHKDKIKPSVDDKFVSFISIFVIFVVAFALKDIYVSCITGFAVIGRVLLAILPAVGMFLYTWAMQYRMKKSKKVLRILMAISGLLIFAPMVTLACVAYGKADFLLFRFYMYILPIFMIIVLPKLENLTDSGRAVIGRIWGLKHYIETAEKDRLEMLVKDDPSLFYKVLPYAYVLGVTDVYMKKFEDIEIIQPDWYQTASTDHFTFTHIWLLNSSINNVSTNMTRAMIQNSVNKISSSGSGHSGGGWSSGGGGFSGGGFGGGGGGRW